MALLHGILPPACPATAVREPCSAARGTPYRSVFLFDQSSHKVAPPPDSSEAPAAKWLALGGLAGGVSGAAVGGGIGHLLLDRGDVFIPGGLIMGAGVGLGIGEPLGVHLANGRRGNYFTNVLVSTGVLGISSALVWGVVSRLEAGDAGIVLGGSLLTAIYIGTSIGIERVTAR